VRPQRAGGFWSGVGGLIDSIPFHVDRSTAGMGFGAVRWGKPKGRANLARALADDADDMIRLRGGVKPDDIEEILYAAEAQLAARHAATEARIRANVAATRNGTRSSNFDKLVAAEERLAARVAREASQARVRSHDSVVYDDYFPIGDTLPTLPPRYHYRNVDGRTHVVRNPGSASEIPPLHLEGGRLVFGHTPSVVRDTAVRTEFLQKLATNKNIPRRIRHSLEDGEVPIGFQVHHKKALFDGGTDTVDNMVLQGTDLHRTTHRYYRVGGQIPSINPRPGTASEY